MACSFCKSVRKIINNVIHKPIVITRPIVKGSKPKTYRLGRIKK